MRGMGFEGFEKAKKGLIFFFVLKMIMNSRMRETGFYYSFYYYFIYLFFFNLKEKEKKRN